MSYYYAANITLFYTRHNKCEFEMSGNSIKLGMTDLECDTKAFGVTVATGIWPNKVSYTCLACLHSYTSDDIVKMEGRK